MKNNGRFIAFLNLVSYLFHLRPTNDYSAFA